MAGRLPLSIDQPFRKNNLTVGSGWRAFIAPYNVAVGSATANLTLGPTILDLMANGPINDAALPNGFRDLGWINSVNPQSQTKIGQIGSGFHGAIKAQYKGYVGENIQFKMREITHMALKVATNSDVINLLANPTPSTVGPISGGGASRYRMGSYDGNVTLTLLDAPTGLAVGNYIVCDLDYNNTSFGLVGDDAQPVFQGLVNDIDYIRKTSDYVNRIVGISGSVLTLSQPFVGGGSSSAPIVPTAPATAPQTGSIVQQINGFAAREGGSFIKEWSGVFILDTIDGAQFVWYYPHISGMTFTGMPTWAINNIGQTDASGFELDCTMAALAFNDPEDGQTVVGYRAFYPRGRSQDIGV